MMARIKRLLGYTDTDVDELKAAIEKQKKAVKLAREVTRNSELTTAKSIARDASVTLDIVNRAMEARHGHR